MTVLKLSEISRVADSVDADGRSDLADRLAAPWGALPGSCRFWRSSASHVFTVRLLGGTGYLRAVPQGHRDRARLEAVTRLTAQLHGRGLRVAAPVPSRGGHLVEAGDGYYSMVIEAAPGDQIDAAELTASRAAAWGAALATLHAQTACDPPAAYVDFDADIARVHPDDPALIDAARVLAERIRALPTDPGCFGLTHGDFELDNLCWQGDQPTAFDFDEARLSWFADDIAQATRDLTALDDFLAGYARVRPLPDLTELRFFEAVRAAESLVRLPGALDTTEGPEWLSRLDSRLRAHLRRQRDLVIDMAHGSADDPGH